MLTYSPFFSLKYLKILFLGTFYFLGTFSHAKQLDSLKTALQQAQSASEKAFALAGLSFGLSSSNADSAMLLAKQGMQISQKIKNDTALASSYNSVGWCYFRLGKKDSAEYFLIKAHGLYHLLKNDNEEGRSLLNLSTVYNEYHDYSRSLNCLITARALLERAKNENMLAYVDRTVGVVYRQQGLYDEAAKSFRSAIIIFKKLNNYAYLADTYTSYGSVFWYRNNVDSALFYYRNAYNIYKSKTRNITGEAYAAESIGNVFYKKANGENRHPWIDSAYYYFTAALVAFTKAGGAENMQYERINIGEVLRIMKQYKASAKYLTEALHYFDSVDNVLYSYNTADGLRRLYRDLNDYKKAYEYSIIEQEYKDSLDSRNRADSIAKMFAQYETEKKDRTIQLLNAQKNLVEEKISRQRIILLSSVAGLLLIAVLFIVLINRSRIKQQLKVLQVRQQLAGDLHDEVGSSLSSILLLSKIASGKPGAEAVNKNMLETIAGNTKEVIDKMSDIVWMMNPKYDEGEKLREKLEQYAFRVKSAAIFPINITIHPAIDTIKFPMEIRKNIFLIFKEAINNALKYSKATEMNISLQVIDKNIHLCIADNGKGFSKATVIAGNGFETMALRAKACKGSFDIQSAPGNGTQVKVIVPFPRFR